MIIGILLVTCGPGECVQLLNSAVFILRFKWSRDAVFMRYRATCGSVLLFIASYFYDGLFLVYLPICRQIMFVTDVQGFPAIYQSGFILFICVGRGWCRVRKILLPFGVFPCKTRNERCLFQLENPSSNTVNQRCTDNRSSRFAARFAWLQGINQCDIVFEKQVTWCVYQVKLSSFLVPCERNFFFMSNHRSRISHVINQIVLQDFNFFNLKLKLQEKIPELSLSVVDWAHATTLGLSSPVYVKLFQKQIDQLLILWVIFAVFPWARHH